MSADMHDDDKPETDQQVLDEALAILKRTFDSVSIFVSRYEPGEDDDDTISLWTGSGNWHTRHGQIREWLLKREEVARVEAQRAMDD